MTVTEKEREAANRAMKAKRENGYVVAAEFVSDTGRIALELSTGVRLEFPAHLAEGLSGAPSDALREIEITPSGLGLHWPQLDADLYVPALLEGVLGSKRWMAQQLGKAGGSARTAVKSAASRENGKKGGRPPRKTARALDLG